MRLSLAAVTCTLALAVGAGRADAAAYTFQTIDAGGYPGSTSLFGINDHQQIVGFGNYSRYFIYSMGTYDFLTPGGSFFRVNNAGQINNSEQIVSEKFVYANGTLPNLNPPNNFNPFVRAQLVLNGVNDLGQVVGTYESVRVDGGLGVIITNSDSTVTPLNLSSVDNNAVFASGINNAGQVAGTHYLVQSGEQVGFLDTGGIVTNIKPPGALPYTIQTGGLSNAGEVSGSYSDSIGLHGFVFDNGIYTTIDVPGAISTVATGVNVAGDVVGTYTDSTGTYGFLATPVSVPEPTSLTLLTTALTALVLAVRRRPTA